MIERFEQAAVAPRAEPPKHRRSRRQIVGKEPPSDPASQHVEDGVQNLAQRPLARPPSDAWLWHVRLDQSPFGIGQISFVTQPFAAMLPPSGRGPHRASSEASTTTGITTASATQPIFGTDTKETLLGVDPGERYPAHGLTPHQQ